MNTSGHSDRTSGKLIHQPANDAREKTPPGHVALFILSIVPLFKNTRTIQTYRRGYQQSSERSTSEAFATVAHKDNEWFR